MKKWIGNKKNGFELRYCDNEELDEVVLWINDKVVMHMEAMSEVCYWFGFYLDSHEIHMNISSKNIKSHIEAKITDSIRRLKDEKVPDNSC